jgi:hypothetical protein
MAVKKNLIHAAPINPSNREMAIHFSFGHDGLTEKKGRGILMVS